MLEELSIQNYALIDSVSLAFQSGFTVLSGETGAGKSIIVEAISFLLGAKADAAVVRSGYDGAVVQAIVSVKPENHEARHWLGTREIESDDGRFIIRRTMKCSGRGSIYLQNVQITRTDLAQFMALLFDIHGQHTHESLLHTGTHLIYLDRFAGLEDEVTRYRQTFGTYTEKKQAIEDSRTRERDRNARREMLQYAIDEIDTAAPRASESRELEAEARRLGDFEKLAEQINSVCDHFFDGEESAFSFSRKTRTALESAADIDESLGAVATRFKDWYYEAEDIAEEIRSYRDTLRNDPGRLEEVDDRLAVLFRLKKKYGTDEEAVLAYRDSAQAEIESLSRLETDRESLQREIVALDHELGIQAAALHEKRAVAAHDLEKRISDILLVLGMPNVRFSVALQEQRRGATGTDKVEFLISANPGEPLRELARIASGGELSRVMLAIKTVLSGTDTLETLIFDEIDTGIGGTVALAVGEYLAMIGKLKQIFCVTHLASIAVRADNHLRVRKKDEAGRTVTGVTALNPEERRQEIARMLSGDAGTEALAHADALLAKYGPH
jgi:DNA repair protein RecN (Recombination protein N)